MGDQTLLICLRVADGTPPPMTQSDEGICVRCEADVWVSASGRRAIAEMGAVTVCERCGHAAAAAAGEDRTFLMAPGAADELEDVGGPDASAAARQLMDILNRPQRGRFTGEPFQR